MKTIPDASLMNRRAVMWRGSLCLAAGIASPMLATDETASPLLRIGLLTDLHYGDKEPTKTRYYRETPGKLKEAVAKFNEIKPAFVIELGDLIDQAPTVEQEIAWLEEIDMIYAGLTCPRHYVLGNHCVATLTKEEFAQHSGASKKPHYSFDQNGVHFVVLDACYRSDGAPYGRNNADWKDANVPEAELEWLRKDLAATAGPVVVFAHQRLDEAAPHSVLNATAVRKVLEDSGKVLAVFQGHSHKNDYQEIQGIHYCTLVALIEGSGADNNGYAVLEVMPDRSLRLQGFRQQVDQKWAGKAG
ncbi:metallophosphoesterase family protein [Verrucomicrobium spinosum]|uniref:metallophosphoesterase family protein n=1 Tax=Verrucomicrobium spinosum TaxID=2736 RepID=UPI0005C56107|nr:metallophosphoesterase [Verrucomicrobium spinosum]